MAEAVKAATIERLSNCPLCGGAAWKTLAVPGNWIGPNVFGDLQGSLGLVQCHGCGLVFTNPRPSHEKLFEFYSGDTYTCHEATGSASAGAKANFILDRIQNHLPSDAPRVLLDYGAGGGGFLKTARDKGWDVQGFEPGQRGLESCRQAGLNVTDNLHELPSQKFGLVTLHHVFEHLSNPTEILSQIRDYIAPQGRLYIEVPNVRSLRARLAAPFLTQKFSIDQRHRAYPIHLMYYSDQTLRKMLKKAGWHVEATLTLGLGLDEFFVKPEKPVSHNDQPNRPNHHGSVPAKPKLRHRLRDAFLNLGLGENLAVIARSE